jgi:hypothetical protein
VASEVFTIGPYGGLRIELDALLEIVRSETSSPLDPDDLSLAEGHLRDVLGDSEARATPMPGLGRRIGEGRYLAVGALGALGLSIILGPVLHVLAAGTALGSARRLLRWDRSWRPQVIAIYARLEGVQRDVFEAIHEAQNEWIVVNYDALEEGQYSNAYGRVAPTATDVAMRLTGRASEVDVREALAVLARRGILDTDGSGYWIRF